MFRQIAEIAKTTALSLNITSVGENELQVIVIPKTKEGANPAMSQPLVLTATPEELDEKFAGILSEYGGARKTLEETLEDAKLFMEAAGKSAQASATAAAKSPPAEKVVAPAAPNAKGANAVADHNSTPESDDDLFS